MVACSSAEAEFCAIAQGICEGIWLNRLLQELRVPLEYPMVLYYNNQTATSIAKNPIHHDHTKHVEIDRHFVNEKIEEGVFKGSTLRQITKRMTFSQKLLLELTSNI